MAPTPGTPRQRVRSAARPLKRTVSDSAAPPKKRRYIPGGPGGGGRYIDEDGHEIPVGGTGPGGYAYTGPRGRVGRINAERQGLPVAEPSPSASYNNRRPRRERPPAGPRSSSAAAAAAIVAQTDGYKPREERGWEEFHQELDIEADLPVYSADQVDGVSPAVSVPGTPANGPAVNSIAGDDGSQVSEEVRRAQATVDANLLPRSGAINGTNGSPLKRRVGRPSKKLDSMLSGLGSPPVPRITPLPTMNPKEKLNLPKPACRQIDTFKAYEESEAVKINYVDRTMARIGYQEGDVFILPKRSLIRLHEPSIEEDLDVAVKTGPDSQSPAVTHIRVEYDMDEQDERWLEQLNVQRREEGIEPIKPAVFELTITQIEKEWHALEKRIPKPNPKPPQTHRPRSSSAAAVNGEPVSQGEEQDTKCAICDDGDCENTNAIVFCDGCDLAVHQECYGVPYIPEGQWLCRRCQLVGRGTPASEHACCIFCPNPDGAFKQTTTMKWAHLLCAMWIPEVSLGNPTFQEPVQDVEKVPKTRWKLTCYICKQRMGACIQCGHKSCFEAFHVTCARRARLCLSMKSSQSGNPDDATVLKAYCDRHSPTEWRRHNDVTWATAEAKAYYRRNLRNIQWGDSQAYALSIGSAHVPSVEGLDEGADDVTDPKRKRNPTVKSWRLPSGAPVVPQAVYQNVDTTLGNHFNVRKRKEFTQEACRYWTLKREARRGAALIKRLQLQMESFTSMEITRRDFAGMGAAGRPRLQRRIEFVEYLDKDMEDIVSISQQLKEREKRKLEEVKTMRDMLNLIHFPIPPLLQPILDKAQSLDSKGVFAEGFSTVQTKLDEKLYTTVQSFSEDISGVFSSVIGFATITNVGDAEQQLSGVAHSSLTSEQKQIKALAKRIVKAIQPLYEDALRKESDLAGKTYEQDLPNLEALLDQKLHRQTDATMLDADQESPPEAQQLNEAAKSGGLDGRGHEVLVNGNTKGKSAVQLAPTPEENAADNPHARDEAADEAAIAAQFDQDAMHGAPSSTMEVDGQASPPTPPQSESNQLGPLSNGGIPWYMEAFDPVGTTVHDEKWTGRDVLRDMSDLSEMDDDELNGLADTEELSPVEATAPEKNGGAQQLASRTRKKRTRSRR